MVVIRVDRHPRVDGLRRGNDAVVAPLLHLSAELSELRDDRPAEVQGKGGGKRSIRAKKLENK